jgi:hypothetical protein
MSSKKNSLSRTIARKRQSIRDKEDFANKKRKDVIEKQMRRRATLAMVWNQEINKGEGLADFQICPSKGTVTLGN